MTASDKDVFVEGSPGVFRLEAPLTFASVAGLRDRGIELIHAATRAQGLILDLHAVPAVDSAGLALLIDWLAEARAASRPLKYQQPPQTLVALARLSDVEKLIAA
jgi:phospholipid transport system transporter-binding protein